MRADARVAGGLDEVQARVDAVVDYLLPVDAVLLLEVLVEAGLDILEDGLPAISWTWCQKRADVTEPGDACLSSLSTKSPKPGVSTTVSLSRTPFSSMSVLGIRRVVAKRVSRR